jgi:phage tail-like protein
MPSLPGVPSPPPMPAMPAMPAMPSAPPMPTLPSMPPVPTPPAMPGAPTAMANAAKAGGAASAAKNGKNLQDPAVSIRFHLTVEALPIGWWNSFEGLGMETAVMQLEEGGNNAFVHQLPTRLKYTNIKLSRPINEESHLVAKWFMDIAKVVTRGKNASVKAVDGADKTIAEWHLLDVVPVRWTGPTFNVESPKMATETLEMAFHGFMADAAKGA